MKCGCGCGSTTDIASKTRTECGWVKGKHKPYIHGHNRRKLTHYTINKNGCWVWKLHIDKGGYGIVRIAGRNLMAHRYLYELHKGAIPTGLTLDHLCYNKACVNPDHLEPVTLRTNVRRRQSNKLSEDLANTIRESTLTNKQLAVLYGVDPSTISHLKANRIWGAL